MADDKEKKCVDCPEGESPSLFGDSLPAEKKRRGVPARERKAKYPHTRILGFYDQTHFDTHSRDVKIGDWKAASKNIKTALKRGITEREIMDAIVYYHKQDDDWAIGHRFDRFMASLDEYVDRAKKRAGTLNRGKRTGDMLTEIKDLEAKIKADPDLDFGYEGRKLRQLRGLYGERDRRQQRGRRKP